jgi:hypothetical protein
VNEAFRDYIRGHSKPIGVGVMVLGGILASVFLPRSLERVAIVALIVVFAVFYVWAEFPLPQWKPAEHAMTIRRRLKRTRTIFQRIMVPVVVLWCASVTLYDTQQTELQRYALAVGGGSSLVWIAWLFAKDGLRCPRCGTDFKQERVAKVGRWSMDTRGAEDLWDCCPHCGVSFDEPSTPISPVS